MRPRWRDARLLGGILLILISVVLGARVLAAADDSVPVWSLTRDLSTGSVLGPSDLQPVDVRLGSAASAYVGAETGAPTGWVLARPMTRGELLPVDAVTRPGQGAPLRQVTVAVERLHAPAGLARGQRVDVYVTPDDGPTRPVLAAALVADLVQEAGRLGPSGSALGVVLAVPPGDVQPLVQALQDGAIDLVAGSPIAGSEAS